MSISPKICKISKGTTLEELANFFRLTEEQLKRYHNTYCPLDDLIGHDIPNHVTIIYVPPEDKELREKIFNPNGGNYISYKSKNTLDNKKSYQKRYGIIQKTFHDDKEKLKIHYEIEIKKTNTNVELTRHPVYINHQRPDFIVEEIADKVGDILYPLQLGLNDNGSIKEIINFKEIDSRWRKLKPELEDYYKGEITGDIIKKIENQLKSKSRTLAKIKDSLFYLLHFIPIYEVFDENKKYTFHQEIPFVHEQKNILFEITMSIDEEISETKKIFIKAEGKSVDNIFSNNPEKSVNSEDSGDEKSKGSFYFTYKLNSKDNSIFSIYGEVGIELSAYDTKIIFECYEQV
ncbi:hypothetical protein NZ698_19060 [Chryseobacterium sp. PBS4-4]|uniref:LysM domain-containing protein n=1 Tax=Chryseobacterium edaphi TaxID=2976532 RepID=A0ABT2WAN6_9FLAO|nr:hypothetical protein [Chryseobacterium edaphi]MCU7619285.1 hypothetical protein [Chryseobacterium edaphi]